MRLSSVVTTAVVLLSSVCTSLAVADDHLKVVQGDHVLKDFRFHGGEQMDITIHYRTLGSSENPAVLVLHGTTGNGASLLGQGFAGALFGPGQALDAKKYYIILPDAIGTGESSKPSDGLRASFPEYNYDDMVDAQYRLLREGLGIDHLRLAIGDSMGGMHVWTWAVRYPDFADALVPMASLPAPMAGRNWMTRRMLIDAIVTDPAWDNGNYKEQPPNIRLMNVWFGLATAGGDQGLWAKAPTNAQADAFVDARLATAKVGDANDVLYQWRSSRDFDPSADLEKISAHLLAINSADDERNPISLQILETAMPRIKNGQFFIIPSGSHTSGHGTTGSQAELYAERLRTFLQQVPVRRK